MLRLPLPKRSCSKGFTLLEVLIATSILVIGVSAMAALSAVMLTRGRQSKYMTLSGTLASEKLEDLSRWKGNIIAGLDSSDPEICVEAGDASEGGLTADTTNSITCNGVTENISYFDNVSIDVTNSTDCGNASNGCFAESTSSTVSGVTTYYTTYHAPDGTIPGNSAGTTTAPSNMTFRRRWLIEANQPVVGVRRITVSVTLLDQSVRPGVNFSMSMVRP
jgi:prepilin-type N-terminal cleavage/methylation domain-containing protein